MGQVHDPPATLLPAHELPGRSVCSVGLRDSCQKQVCISIGEGSLCWAALAAGHSTFVENALVISGLQGSQPPALPVLVCQLCPRGQSLEASGHTAPLQRLRASPDGLWAAFRGWGSTPGPCRRKVTVKERQHPGQKRWVGSERRLMILLADLFLQTANTFWTSLGQVLCVMILVTSPGSCQHGWGI